MDYYPAFAAYLTNPSELEALYQTAARRGETNLFAEALGRCLADQPENLLLQAWHVRLLSAAAEPERPAAGGAQWKLAVPLAIANGLALWGLSDPRLSFPPDIPALLPLAAPLTALFVIAFLFLSSRTQLRRTLWVGALLVILSAAALLLNHFVVAANSQDYLILLIPHLALLAWASVGLVLIGPAASAENAFAYLIKSLEVMIVAGVYLIAGLALGGITLGMFAALSITLPEVLLRLIAAGGAGLIPVCAVATVYNPRRAPQDQDFKQGLSKFTGTMMRLLLPLTLAVLVVYLFVIPFNFFQPFQNRDVLIIYNAMLFAIMALIIGATPLHLAELAPRLRSALRLGILALAVLATLVSLYALSALVYRTVMDTFTINRLTMLGWNLINIVLLVLMIVRLVGQRRRSGVESWNDPIQAVTRLGAFAYIAWTLFVILVMPFLFY